MATTPLKRRHVFYLSGFDPRGPAFYRRLYQDEALKQSQLSGMPCTISPADKRSRLSSGWGISADAAGQTVDTRYEFLRWDDIVRRHWQRNELTVLLHYLRAVFLYVATGALGRILSVAWPPFVAGMAPLVLLLLVLVLAAGAGWGAGALGVTAGLPAAAAVAGALAVSVGALQLGRILAQRLNVFWLLRIYAFSAKQGCNQVPDLDRRLDEFAQRVVEQVCAAEQDEVLIVGHSVGATVALSVLARALRLQPALAAKGPRIGLVTLGHCVPMLSLLPSAEGFRDELEVVAGAAGIEWIDFTAPTDGACFAFVDALAVSGIAPVRGGVRPKLLSPRFPTLFSPQRYARMRRDWYRNHFQYLMAGEKLGEYDYFAITAGPVPLAERYRAKASVSHAPFSKSSAKVPA